MRYRYVFFIFLTFVILPQTPCLEEVGLLESLKNVTANDLYIPDVTMVGCKSGLSPKIIYDENKTSVVKLNYPDGAIVVGKVVVVCPPKNESGADDIVSKAMSRARNLVDEGNDCVVVKLLPGKYVLNRPVFIDRSGIVLAGTSTEETILIFNKPLSDAINLGYGGQKQWSWRGGLLWFAADPMRLKDGKGKVRSVKLPLKVGQKRIGLHKEKQNQKNIFIKEQDPLLIVTELSKSSTEQIYGSNLDLDALGGFETLGSKRGGAVFRFMTRCKKIEENGEIILSNAIPIDMSGEDYSFMGPATGFIENTGIANLTIAFPKHYYAQVKRTRYQHLKERGFNAVFFDGVIDGWVCGVKTINADTSIVLEESHNITLKNVTIDGDQDHVAHHGITLRAYTSRVLATGIELKSRVHHGLSAQDMANHIVYRRCDLHHGTIECHRGMPFDMVRTDIRIRNCDGYGGGSIGPFCGRRVVTWNVRFDKEGKHRKKGMGVLLNPEQYCRGTIMGISGLSELPKIDKPWATMPGMKGTVMCGFGKVPQVKDLYLHLCHINDQNDKK